MSEQKDTIKTFQNLALPTLFVDHLLLGRREDNLFLLRFAAELPEGLMEQTRVIVNKERLIAMIDILCYTAEYYPSKSKPGQKLSAKATSAK
jgi:hypothetical protein